MPKRNTTFASARAQRRIERILAALKGKKLPTATIAAIVHCDMSMATDYIAFLKAEPRRVRIAGYEVVNGSKRPLYGLGSGPDEPMTRKSNTERWALVKADPEKYAASLASRRDSHRRKRAAVPPEQRQRDRRIYEPPLAEQVETLVLSRPGRTIDQIAADLNANERAVLGVVRKLRDSGRLRRAEHGKGKKYQWETPENPLPAPLNIKPQSIFSALGL